MLAMTEAWRAGLLGRQYWLRNIIAGVIVGIVALPLAMAFAIASGAKPEQGLYTAIVAGVAVSLCGGSRVQIAGPTGAFIVVLAGITAQYGIVGLQVATVMAGIMLLLLGLTRMGAIIRFIPDPVIVGFTAGIGIIIFVGQWRYFFGLGDIPSQAHFHQTFWLLLNALPDAHFPTLLLALMSLALVILGPKLPGCRRLPGPLLALTCATLLQTFWPQSGIQTIGSLFGGIPQGLPSFSMPEFSWSQVLSLVGPAFTIAMLGAIESLLSAAVADGMAGTRHDPNQELIGQGIANIAAPFFGGFAATGAIARTATNIRNGGNSPLAGIVHAVTLVVILVLLAPLAAHIPLATLAAILFVVAWNMSEVRHVVYMIKRAPVADTVILLTTLLLTVFADVVVAVNIGVILATLHFVRRMAASVEVSETGVHELQQELTQLGLSSLPEGVAVFAVDGPFFFGAVESFERALSHINQDPHTLIIRLKWVPFIDITGLQTLDEVIGDLQRRGIRVLVSGANPRVSSKLMKAGIVDKLGKHHYFQQFIDAVVHALNHSPKP